VFTLGTLWLCARELGYTVGNFGSDARGVLLPGAVAAAIMTPVALVTDRIAVLVVSLLVAGAAFVLIMARQDPDGRLAQLLTRSRVSTG